MPTWAWVLVLLVVIGAAGFLFTSLRQPRVGYSDGPIARAHSDSSNVDASDSVTAESIAGGLGLKVYGNNCASCHQANGTGLPSVFPPLKGNSVVLNDDASEHIIVILEGLQDKEIDCVHYASPMPGFAAVLSDEEIAAVVNHERTQWGNSAKIVNIEEVKRLRK